jgi:hypothetical protein
MPRSIPTFGARAGISQSCSSKGRLRLLAAFVRGVGFSPARSGLGVFSFFFVDLLARGEGQALRLSDRASGRVRPGLFRRLARLLSGVLKPESEIGITPLSAHANNQAEIRLHLLDKEVVIATLVFGGGDPP